MIVIFEGHSSRIHQSTQLTTIYKDEYGDGHETFRAIRHSIVGICWSDSLVFDDVKESWSNFFNGPLKDTLLPHYNKIADLVNIGDHIALIEEDRKFLKKFDETISSKLIAGADAIFDAREGAKGMQILKKVRKNHKNCSFTAAFSIQCAAFNIPLLQSMIAYTFMEWACGQKRIRFSLENMDECEKFFRSEFPNLADRVGKWLSDNSGDLKLTA